MTEITGQHLTDFMAQHLPIAKALGMEVESFAANQLILRAALQPNINDKQSAFGGSVYSVCVMACWGMAYLQALINKIETPNIAVGRAEIRYKAPVLADFEAVCTVADADIFDDWISDYWQHGKAKITLLSYITAPGDPAKKIVEFQGQFTIYE